MRSFEYTVQDELGIHARPAGRLIQEIKAYPCDTAIVKGDKRCDAKKLFGVMGMGVKCGDTIRVECSGEDEEAFLEKLKAFFEENF